MSDILSKITALRQERGQRVAEMRSFLDAIDGSPTGEQLAELSQREATIAGLDTLERSYSQQATREGLAERVDAARAETSKGEHRGTGADEYREAFYAFVAGNASPEQRAALNKTNASEGAIFVPSTLDAAIIRTARDFGVIRQLANVLTTDTGNDIVVAKDGGHVSAGWVAEGGPAPESEPTFGSLTLKAFKMGVYAKLSDEVVRDSAVDLEAYVSDEFGQARAILENTAYLLGDGNGKPSGLLHATAGLSAGRYMAGSTGQTSSVTGDNLIDLVYKIKAAYRRNGAFLMNDVTIPVARKLKNSQGDYIWQDALRGGEPSTLLGKSVYTDPDMPTMAANAKSIVFGDFNRGYRIRDVRATTIKRLGELFALNGQIGFLMWATTEGKVVDENAFAVYQNSAT